MKQLERTPARSTSAPNRIGNTKPAKPPASPTTPDTAPMLSGKSLAMNLNTDALPTAIATPAMNKIAVNNTEFRPICKLQGPLTVATTISVCG